MPRNVTIEYTCDVCGAPILDEEAIFAFAVSYAKPGPGLKTIHLQDEQPYGCSPAHAAEAAKRHIDQLEEQRKLNAGVLLSGGGEALQEQPEHHE